VSEAEQKFLQRFLNNSDAYGLQQSNGSYIAIRQSISDDLLESHFRGDRTIGVYTTNPINNTSRYLCIDIDDDHQTTEFNRLLHYFNVNNLVYLRESVRPGRLGHVWLFFDRPVDTALVHRLGIYACMLSGLKAEVFAKQPHLKPHQLGNLVRLPLGSHRKTGKPGLFYDCPSEDIQEQLEWFLHQPINSANLVVDICQNLPTLAPKPSRRLQNTPKTPLLAEFPSDYDWKESGSGELIGRCPKCASQNYDRTGNNLCINPEKNVLFCHRGCSFIQIMRSLRV
jgi:hypothetical protein